MQLVLGYLEIFLQQNLPKFVLKLLQHSRQLIELIHQNLILLFLRVLEVLKLLDQKSFIYFIYFIFIYFIVEIIFSKKEKRKQTLFFELTRIETLLNTS